MKKLLAASSLLLVAAAVFGIWLGFDGASPVAHRQRGWNGPKEPGSILWPHWATVWGEFGIAALGLGCLLVAIVGGVWLLSAWVETATKNIAAVKAIPPAAGPSATAPPPEVVHLAQQTQLMATGANAALRTAMARFIETGDDEGAERLARVLSEFTADNDDNAPR